MSSVSGNNGVGSTTLVLTPELLSSFGECDPFLHQPFAPGDRVCRCGACGYIIRAELINDNQCPFGHQFTPVAVLTDANVRTLHPHPRYTPPPTPTSPPVLRLRHNASSSAANRMGALQLRHNASSSATNQTGVAQPDRRDRMLPWRRTIRFLSNAVLAATALILLLLVVSLLDSGNAAGQVIPARFLIRLRILCEQIARNLAGAPSRILGVLRRLFPFL